MSHITVMDRSGMSTAAAAVYAAGFLAVPLTAHADPTIPLPPLPCTQYGFNGDVVLSQSNGYTVNFTSTGPAASGKAYARSGSSVMEGVVSGSIAGSHVDFTIRWGGGPQGHYTGDIGADGIAHGRTVDEANPVSQANWDSTHPLICITPVAPAPAPPKTATVTADVDVYTSRTVTIRTQTAS